MLTHKLFGVKDPIPDGLRSCVVYKFACAGCNACYVGEITWHFSTRVCEHLVGLIFVGYVPLVSQSPVPFNIIVYSLANYHLSQIWANT